MASVKEQIQNCYEQTTGKAESKMGLEGNFTFDFTAASKLDFTSIWYQEIVSQLQTCI